MGRVRKNPTQSLEKKEREQNERRAFKTEKAVRSICLRGERGKLCEFACRPDAPDRSVSCHCIAFQELLRHILVPPPE